jgi:choloylglycine hydrolase
VNEAVDILSSYNIDFGGGPPLHYLVADRTGRAALVEFFQGEMVVLPNQAPWHLATNFLRASAGESAQGQCWRYDRIRQGLETAEGTLGAEDAMALLASVAQPSTQWSVVYGLSSGDVTVSMGGSYASPHSLHLSLAIEP